MRWHPLGSDKLNPVIPATETGSTVQMPVRTSNHRSRINQIRFPTTRVPNVQDSCWDARHPSLFGVLSADVPRGRGSAGTL